MKSWTGRILVLGVCLLAMAVPCLAEEAAATPRPMTVDDLWTMERVGSPALSPDGRRVAFTVTRFDEDKNKGNSDIWIVDVAGGSEPRRMTWNEGSDSGPFWSPDGKYLGFLSKRGEALASQIHLLPMGGGEAEPVTDLPFSPAAPLWSPDGRQIYFLGRTWPDLNDDFEEVKKRLDERKEDKTHVRATDTRLVRYWDHYLTDGRSTHLFVLDLETREVRDLLPGSDRLLPFWSNSGTFDISPDGTEIAFAANVTAPPFRTLNFDLHVMPAIGGEPRNVTADNPASDSSPRYSPDGRFILYGRNRRPEIAPDFTRMALYDRKSGKSAPLAEDWDGQPGGWRFTPDGRTVVFHAQERGRVNLYSIPVAGGKVTRLVQEGSTGGVRCGPEGLLVFARQSFTEPTELMAIKIGDEQPRALTAFNRVRLAELDLGTVEDTSFKGADGEDVQMFVLLPPGFDATQKWPLLVLIHGGPHGAWTDSFHYRWNAALWAAPGYVTAAVNFHGSTGFGQAFAESILGAHGDKPFTDVMNAADALIARDYVDGERLAATGGSYGGYMVSWILGHTDRFSALINHAGVYDLMAQFGSDWTWGRANNYGATPWEDPTRIDRWSPSRFAEGFSTPTLILHGEKDYRVPYTQGLNLHGVLTAKGVPSRLVVFPDENHWILKPQSARIWWDEVHGWLEQYVGAGPKPAD